ncbi:50S ribosomal protein L25/general stress protein Ctc [Oceanobacillus halophilus]|uniref:Large ribosomal subunit protein bL25 n=1 Tax=Oceanobacillus halophilus TaxID=930130 RepID=A0A495A282_9BACI|nr:50S ribosomal protein L25/general stress protein Ctc [Oceanobacillus halophilus]RKQ33029.1 50S ribosomal protein L25/general stress protein Ctc [Oceanobacillus halophilus]
MSVTLKAIKRNDLTRSNTKTLRENGQVPAVVYGKQKEPQAIAVDSIELVKVIRDNGKNAVLSLALDTDNTVDVMFYDYQVDPLKDNLVHVDFYMADMSEARDVSVPIRLEGEPNGQGVLQQPLFEVQVRAKPNDIPEEVTVDISSLEIGDVITIADLPANNKYEFIDDPESTVATVLAPDTNVAEEHAEEVEEAEAGEEESGEE